MTIINRNKKVKEGAKHTTISISPTCLDNLRIFSDKGETYEAAIWRMMKHYLSCPSGQKAHFASKRAKAL